VASTVPVAEVALIDLAVEADPVIWIARLKIGRVVTFQASVSKDFREAALIAVVAAVDSTVVIVSEVGAGSAAIALVAAVDLGAAASADSVVAEEDSAVFAAAADDEN
jgi:hypothetical protein